MNRLLEERKVKALEKIADELEFSNYIATNLGTGKPASIAQVSERFKESYKDMRESFASYKSERQRS